MNHEIIFTDDETEGVLTVEGACACGWSGGNVRPSRPGRLEQMHAHLQDNHDAWVHAQGLGE